MKKGLIVTLVMVAIALSGYHASARAPEVSDVPDIIIGDAPGTTFPNLFVWEDAFDLNTKVNDPDGSDDQIVWSFYEATGTYTINGVASLSDPADAVTPGANAIAGPSVTAADPAEDDLGAYVTVDTDPLTPTFRNANLSPLAGDELDGTDPGAAGIVASETKVLTLFASDGSTVGMADMMVYTDNDGWDRTSGTEEAPLVQNYDFTSSTYGFNTVVEAGTVTITSSGAICLETPAAGDHKGEWLSPYGDPTYGIPIVANSVYRCRMTASTTASGVNTEPLWMFIFDNGSESGDPGTGAGAYAGEFVFLAADNQNGANAINNLSQFDCWAAPLAVQTAQWNGATAGLGNATLAPYYDMRVRFRIFDLASGGWAGESDLGTICLEQMVINRYDLADMNRGTVVFEDTAVDLTNWRTRLVTGTSNMTQTDQGDGVRLAPAATRWDDDSYELIPGDGNLGSYSDAEVADDFPVVWQSDKLLLIEAAISAPTDTDEPADLIRIGMDCPTNELSYMNSQSANLAGGGSPTTSAATYSSFFYTHNVSATPLASLRRLRPRFDFLNATDFSSGGKAGGFDPLKIHSFKVTEVTF